MNRVELKLFYDDREFALGFTVDSLLELRRALTFLSDVTIQRYRDLTDGKEFDEKTKSEYKPPIAYGKP